MPENGAAVKNKLLRATLCRNSMRYTKYFLIPCAQIHLYKVKETAVLYGTIH